MNTNWLISKAAAFLFIFTGMVNYVHAEDIDSLSVLSDSLSQTIQVDSLNSTVTSIPVGAVSDSLLTQYRIDSLERCIDSLRIENAKLKAPSRSKWRNFIPAFAKLQFAGNMGLISAGIGWSYGTNKQWETDLLLGYLPQYDSKTAKATLTIRENFIPWKKKMWRNFDIEPLATGIYINSVLHGDFWVSQPDRYPKGYYWFATKMRINIYVGQRFVYNFRPRKRGMPKSISFYYEFSTCDFYLIQKIKNSSLGFSDYVSLSFGLKVQWL